MSVLKKQVSDMFQNRNRMGRPLDKLNKNYYVERC